MSFSSSVITVNIILDAFVSFFFAFISCRGKREYVDVLLLSLVVSFVMHFCHVALEFVRVE